MVIAIRMPTRCAVVREATLFYIARLNRSFHRVIVQTPKTILKKYHTEVKIRQACMRVLWWCLMVWGCGITPQTDD